MAKSTEHFYNTNKTEPAMKPNKKTPLWPTWAIWVAALTLAIIIAAIAPDKQYPGWTQAIFLTIGVIGGPLGFIAAIINSVYIMHKNKQRQAIREQGFS